MFERTRNTLQTPLMDFGLFGKLMILAFIIAVMAFIAWPSNLHSPRSTISRVKSDLRSLSIALEAYRSEHSDYPPSTYDPDKRFQWGSILDGPTFSRDISLTTPVAYLAEYMHDPFNSEKEPSGYAYWKTGEFFLLFSPGKDGDFDIDPRLLERLFFLESDNAAITSSTILTSSALEYLSGMTFDSTNGSESHGDIWTMNSKSMD